MTSSTTLERPITVSINDRSIEVPSGTTILEAANRIGLSIPTLCALPGLPTTAACRLCVVEVKGEERLQSACSYPLTGSVSILTHSPAALASRRLTIELLLARCLNNTEPYTGDERFQKLVHELGIRHSRFPASVTPLELDHSSPAIRYNPNACIQCGLCVTVCGEQQQVYAINFAGQSIHQTVQPGFDRSLADTECVACGQCTVVCPTGAFVEQDQVTEVINALADPSKLVVGIVSPSVGPAIAPEFGEPEGVDVTGKLTHGLKQIGFDFVFSAGVGHDLVAMETAFELSNRLQTTEATLPLIFSSCPSLVKQIEHQYPELIPHLSVNRSPAQMFGRVLKTYYAQQISRSPSDIILVQITPCLASKYERNRPELEGIDLAITSREVIRLLRIATGYPLTSLTEQPFDDPFHEVSGAGFLSEVTGGTMEATLRTFFELRTGEELIETEFEAIRKLNTLREATVQIGKEELRVAVASGLGNGNILLNQIRDGQTPYHLVEIMACPGGCVGGGGQPQYGTLETVQQISAPLLNADQNNLIRKPRRNPVVNRLYAEFLEHPFGEKAQELLQTSYTERGRY